MNESQIADRIGQSRRSFMKKGALASSAVALGVASTGSTTANTVQDDGNVPNQVLVFAYDYNPGLSFGVINRLQQQTVNRILGQSIGDNGDEVVSDPTEYNGYIAQYQSDDALGEYLLVFVREETLATDTTYQFNPGDATFFNTDINLLQSGLGSGGGDGSSDDDSGNGGSDDSGGDGGN
ncbi:twin-arginine translocation signal domain-containing protein [Halorussus litoreus]|uniref:twin-arginine translocation signal domain-containing protein n=1 Tax=Halorussus litoreus TaxID=1710536 RepID=UPI001300787A|nr:twin-arginine translocation signal domain-containing protein [Halorussus litoreus]